jgi:Flp pilus assembly protein TadD
LIGKNRALELKGQFEEALRTAHWAARYVGPSAEQYLYLAAEYEERGDLDQALLRHRQAVATEPANPAAHRALGMFFHRTGRNEQAIEALTQSLRLEPRQRDVADLLRSLGAEVPAATGDPSAPGAPGTPR